MGRFSADSDQDYYDQIERRTHSGLERSCYECGEPIMVSREEEYMCHVFCEPCLAVIKMRAEARRREEGAA